MEQETLGWLATAVGARARAPGESSAVAARLRGEALALRDVAERTLAELRLYQERFGVPVRRGDSLVFVSGSQGEVGDSSGEIAGEGPTAVTPLPGWALNMALVNPLVHAYETREREWVRWEAEREREAEESAARLGEALNENRALAERLEARGAELAALYRGEAAGEGGSVGTLRQEVRELSELNVLIQEQNEVLLDQSALLREENGRLRAAQEGATQGAAAQERAIASLQACASKRAEADSVVQSLRAELAGCGAELARARREAEGARAAAERADAGVETERAALRTAREQTQAAEARARAGEERALAAGRRADAADRARKSVEAKLAKRTAAHKQHAGLLAELRAELAKGVPGTAPPTSDARITTLGNALRESEQKRARAESALAEERARAALAHAELTAAVAAARARADEATALAEGRNAEIATRTAALSEAREAARTAAAEAATALAAAQSRAAEATRAVTRLEAQLEAITRTAGANAEQLKKVQQEFLAYKLDHTKAIVK